MTRETLAALTLCVALGSAGPAFADNPHSEAQVDTTTQTLVDQDVLRSLQLRLAEQNNLSALQEQLAEEPNDNAESEVELENPLAAS
ncbi:MAG: hypothetical protein AAF515_14965 [Pseudomonadota bacterium]